MTKNIKSKTNRMIIQNSELNLGTRLFPIDRKMRGLFVSSHYSEQPAKEIISRVIKIATKLKCEMILHAGYSFETNKKGSEKVILSTMAKAVKNSTIKTYLAEICHPSRDKRKCLEKKTRYHLIYIKNGKVHTTECLFQTLSKSNETKKAKEFVLNLQKIRPRTIAAEDGYPCLLLECGENNLFNRKHRMYKSARIRKDSLSDELLSALRKIQSRQWCIINPSHYPYKGKQMAEFIADFHKSASRDQRIKYVLTGTNRSETTPKSPMNRPLVWKEGIPRQMKLVYEDHKNLIYMHLFQL